MLAQLAAQAAHRHLDPRLVHGLGLLGVTHLPGQCRVLDAVPVQRQHLEQARLGAGERDLSAGRGDENHQRHVELPLFHVLRRREACKQIPDHRRQLVGAGGFGEVHIGAAQIALEPLHAAHPPGEDDHTEARQRAADAPGDAQAIFLRHVQVQHQDVGQLLLERAVQVLTAVHAAGREALLAQVMHQFLAQPLVILHEDNGGQFRRCRVHVLSSHRSKQTLASSALQRMSVPMAPAVCCDSHSPSPAPDIRRAPSER